jgi:hypothetical protein
VPLLNYTLAFALQLRKSMENLSQGSRVVGDYSLRRLGWLLMESLGWPAEHQSASVTRGWIHARGIGLRYGNRLDKVEPWPDQWGTGWGSGESKGANGTRADYSLTKKSEHVSASIPDDEVRSILRNVFFEGTLTIFNKLRIKQKIKKSVEFL